MNKETRENFSDKKNKRGNDEKTEVANDFDVLAEKLQNKAAERSEREQSEKESK